MATAAAGLDARVHAARRFNRFYTRRIGVLHYQGTLKSPFSLTEVRVLYELRHREAPTASALCRELGLDAGYLSRILRGFQRRGLIERRRSDLDGRRRHLRLTARGVRVFAPLERRQHEDVAAMLKRLPEPDQDAAIAAMQRIEALLGDAKTPETARPSFLLRGHRPGDMGWVIAAHGRLYAGEYGWNATFEALVARIAADFIDKFDPARERCWIAELNGEPVGSVFLVRKSRSVAKLRLLIVDPKARGLGLGKRLVEECIAFARAAGYRKITLWTNDVLHAARAIYVRAGFKLTHSEPHRSFGRDLMGETWDLKL
ncbi:MAG: bifunctional helix-turn-helix transcriptional regulator/GNAT family N-acetyltransferase [Rhodospirillales bacterium]